MTRTKAQHRPKKKNGAVPGGALQRPRMLPAGYSARTVTKTTDNKGRVVLGGRFANRPVIIEMLSETEIIIKLARVIPESETWLYENAEALVAVRTGLAQARAGNVTRGPDVDGDADFAAGLEG